MRLSTISIASLEEQGRWRVEIFLKDNLQQFKTRWPMMQLSEICDEITNAVAPPQSGTGEFIYVGLENVEPITGDIVGTIRKAFGAVRSRSRQFQRGDVLYGRLRPGLRKVLAATEIDGGLCSTEFIVLRPRKMISAGALRAILASRWMSSQLEKLQIGAALPRVSPSDLMALRVPVPNADAQHQLENSLKKLETSRRSAKEALSRAAEDFEGAVGIVLT